ncbi:Transcriptional regulator of ribosomal biogenesis proteins [Gonapodya sp. JEL0774]|nr:Transcriptional regulator of ribosomal biogenesis proteins [Gonapodya sp. JEL0774]
MATTEPIELLLAALRPHAGINDSTGLPPLVPGQSFRAGLLHVPLPEADIMDDSDGSGSEGAPGGEAPSADEREPAENSDSEMDDAYADDAPGPSVNGHSGGSIGNNRTAFDVEADWELADVHRGPGDDSSDDGGGIGSEMGDDESDEDEDVDLSEVDAETPVLATSNSSPRTRPRSLSFSTSAGASGRKGGIPHAGLQKLPRTYPCTFGGCKKVYKNPGGLKYHLLYGHPDPNNPPNPPGFFGRSGKRGRNAPDVFKPYKCCIAGCGKRYKNMNGLKYRKFQQNLEHAHHDLPDDPAALPYTVRSSGRREWNLAACYDPLGAPTNAAHSTSPTHHRALYLSSPPGQPLDPSDASSVSSVRLPKTRRNSKATSGRGASSTFPASYSDVPGGGHFSAPAAVFLNTGMPSILARHAEQLPSQAISGSIPIASPINPPPLPDATPPVPSASLAGALAAAATALRPNQLAKANQIAGVATAAVHISVTPASRTHPSTPRGPPPELSDDESTPEASRLSAAYTSPMLATVQLASSHSTTVSGSLDPLQQLLAAAAIMSAPKESVGVVNGEVNHGVRKKKGGRSEDEDETIKVDGSGSEGADTGHADDGEELLVFPMDDD